MVLFGGNEILRAVAGQIIANLVSSGHPVEKYFPSETAPKLFKNYPTPAPSASQWDKSFQEYVDGVWDEVALGNKR